MGSAEEAAGSPSLLLAGAGKMGGALLQGWLDQGFPADRVTVIDPHLPDEVSAQVKARGIDCNPDGEPSPRGVMVLAIKPQMLGDAAPALGRYTGPDTLLVSIMAGKTIDDLHRAFPAVRAVVRAMPNTPAAVRRGITGVAASDGVTPHHRQVLNRLLGAVGAVEWLDDERLIDAVTAVSGSGPAYVFYLTECLSKAGIEIGLEPELAMRLARKTVEGASALMAASPAVPPDTLRKNVTSPGGTTAAALAVLMEDDRLAKAMAEAVAAARHRAEALSG